jgi:hypothetical protein
MKNINRQKATELIYNSGGRIFTVYFRKRTSQTPRKINGRLGVKSHLRGGKPRYDAGKRYLFRMAEFLSDNVHMGQRYNFGVQYRTVPIEGIYKLVIGGKTYKVK